MSGELHRRQLRDKMEEKWERRNVVRRRRWNSWAFFMLALMIGLCVGATIVHQIWFR